MRTSSQYTGREQSWIKHCFLTKYLEQAAFKTLQGRSPIFNFVDAFAGPWNVSDDNDYTDTSFDQALRTLESVRNNLASRDRRNFLIRYCLCEKRLGAAEELRRYAREKCQFDIFVFEGPFEHNLANITGVLEGGFTFTFVDPTGWNIDSASILKFLRKQNGEFLVNYMAEHINRHAQYDRISNSIDRFLATPEWKRDFDSLPQDWNNERRIQHLLVNRIKSQGAARYVAGFPILKPVQDRVKMRLLLGTMHVKGLEVFRDTQAKVEREQATLRNKLRREKSELSILFTDDHLAEIDLGNDGVGCSKYLREAETSILHQLSRVGSDTFGNLKIEILEEIPIRVPQIKDVVVQLKYRGMVDYRLSGRARKPGDYTRIILVPDGESRTSNTPRVTS